MSQKISFRNTTGKVLSVLIEPSAESFDLLDGDVINIQMKKITSDFDDDFSMVLENDMLILYECRQSTMGIFINEELIYFTPPDIPKI